MADEIVVRGSELGAVAAFLDRAAGRLEALVVEGEAGIGKSTVWEAGVGDAESRGWLVRASRPAYAEQGLTLGGLTDLFGDVGDETLARLPAPQRQALGVSLLRIETTDRSPDQRTLSVAAAGLLRLLAADRPVLIAIDDAQWLDESTAAIFAYALRRLSDQPVGLLATVRTGAETPASGALLPPSPQTGWNTFRSDPCTSRRSIGCSRSGSGGRFRGSSSCGSRRRRAAIRCTRSSSAVR